jgi:murein DD-endopeptidase MepM/ murein hydrolase activator NlpD
VSPAQTQSLEIKLWPQDKMYAYTVAQPWLRDVVFQNIAIINRTGKPVVLERLQISARRDGQVTGDRIVSLSQLGPDLKNFHARYTSGTLALWEPEFHLKDLFPDAKLVGTLPLGANEGVSVRDQYFAFNDQVDGFQITASGRTEDGSTVQASVNIALEEYQSKTRLGLPLTGTWQVANGPFPFTSHRWVIHQEFGYDLWKVDADGLDCKGDGTRYEDYYSYGRPVIAPADATVYACRDDGDDAPLLNGRTVKDPAEFPRKLQAYRDLLFQRGGYQELLGNHLILDHGNGEYSHLVHLKKGSLRVKKGDKVRQGDGLAEVGNSGLSNVPHLHYELVSGPDLPNRRGLPLRFANLNDEPGARLLRYGEFVWNPAAAK